MATDFDLFIIGGGINGVGIARDAQGRGLQVGLAEMSDLGAATSSASTKLFHGGLRYLEFFEFGLVRKALFEREVLLRSMPWMKGRRPAWLVRFGLFLYDTLGGRQILPGTRMVDLTTDPVGRPLKGKFTRAYEYSDCWVEDSRLVVLNARDAADRGAQIMTRTKVIQARRVEGVWEITLEGPDGPKTVTAAGLVNAGGPWVEDIIRGTIHVNATGGVRLVRGSHIVTKRLFNNDKAYFFKAKTARLSLLFHMRRTLP